MNPSSRQQWLTIFGAFVSLEIALTVFGILMGTGGKGLGEVMTGRLEAASQVFTTVCALCVIACIAVTRSRLNPHVVRDWKALQRETLLCLAVGEMAILLGIVGLAKLHLTEFLITAGLALVVDFAAILPTGLKLMRTLDQKS